MKNKAYRFSNHGTYRFPAETARPGPKIKNYGANPGIFDLPIKLKVYQVPEFKLNGACTTNLREMLGHPDLAILSPMSNDKNVEIIAMLVKVVADGHICREEVVLRGAASYDGKPVTLGFVLMGVKGEEIFHVSFLDENDRYMGFPTCEQMGLPAEAAKIYPD